MDSYCKIKHAPVRQRKVRSKCSPWIDSELMLKMRQRLPQKNLLLKTNNELDWLNYRNARNKVNIAIRAAKSNYFNNEIQENSGNIRETWKLINRALDCNSKTTLINELYVEIKHT